jgi:hypothetical protein
MATTLRDFMTQREYEIKEQLKLLKSELRELQIAKVAVEAQAPAVEPVAPVVGPTIKDMIREVLANAPGGLASSEILSAIASMHGKQLERTSLSPQLSRLKDGNLVVLNGVRWFDKTLHDAWQQERMREVFGVTDSEQEYEE